MREFEVKRNKTAGLLIALLILLSMLMMLPSCSSVNHSQKRQMTQLEIQEYERKREQEYFKLVKEGNVEKIDTYFKANPDMFEKYIQSTIPISIAVKNNDMELIKYFCQRGYDVKKADKTFKATALHSAAEYGNVEVAEFFMNRGADINLIDGWKHSPLHLAATGNNVKMMEFLLSKGADINAGIENHDTPLLSASLSGKLKAVKFLMSKGADVSVKSKDWRNVLDLAVRSGNIELVKFLEKKGLKVSYKDSIVIEAVKTGNLIIVKHFVERGCKLNRKRIIADMDLYRDTQGNLKIIRYLVGHGAEINGDEKAGESLLWEAILEGKPEIIKLLLELGVDPNQKDNMGIPYIFAVFINNNRTDKDTDILKIFVASGVKIDVKDSNGNSLLDDAVLKGNVGTVKYLESLGARFSRPKVIGPLHLSASGKRFNVLKYYVEKGMDVNLRDSEGNTPMHYAVACLSPGSLNPNYSFSFVYVLNYPDILLIQYLVAKGAKVNLKNSKGQEPIHCALAFPGNGDKNFCNILEYLVSEGADVNSKDNEGNTPLIYFYKRSNSYEDYKPAETLIKLGAEVNARNRKGESPLFFAVNDYFNSKLQTTNGIKLLLSKGAMPDLNVFKTIIDHKAWKLIPVIIFGNKLILITLVSSLILFIILLLYLFRSHKKQHREVEVQNEG